MLLHSGHLRIPTHFPDGCWTCFVQKQCSVTALWSPYWRWPMTSFYWSFPCQRAVVCLSPSVIMYRSNTKLMVCWFVSFKVDGMLICFLQGWWYVDLLPSRLMVWYVHLLLSRLMVWYVDLLSSRLMVMSICFLQGWWYVDLLPSASSETAYSCHRLSFSAWLSFSFVLLKIGHFLSALNKWECSLPVS